MNICCESQKTGSWLEKFDGGFFRFHLSSVGLVIALGIGLSPALAAAGDDLNARYRKSLIEDQTHLGPGMRIGSMPGDLGRRPTDQSLMPSVGPQLGEPADEQKRDR